MLKSDEVISLSGVQFGTSGARGLVEQFTSDTCAAFTLAFLEILRVNFDVDKIAVAIDNRPSSPLMARACIFAAKQYGLEVVYYGVLPTPALAFSAMQDGIPSIMVTGSHIPFDRNGLKFYRPDGEITKQDEYSILNACVEFSPLGELPNVEFSERAASQYVERYTQFFEQDCLQGKRIGIYQHSSAGRDIYPALFQTLGAEVISLERTDEFVPIDTEAVGVVDKEKAKNWVKDHKLDCLFSTDGDGDRPLVAGEDGNWLKGDTLGLLCASALDIEAVSVPVSCNSIVEYSKRFNHVSRTKIGSPYVLAEFDVLIEKYDSVAGFEANGGFLLGSDLCINTRTLKALPTRDAVLPVLSLLAASRESNISALVSEVETRYTDSDRIKNIPTEKSQKLIKQSKGKESELLSVLLGYDVVVDSVSSLDGLRMHLIDGTVVHLRPSGNAPELRCYVEAQTPEKATELVSVILGKLQNW